MANTVMCKKLGKELPALDFAPMPGEKGQEILGSISKEAWGMWLKHQTMLINEKRLNLMDPDTQKYLLAQMDKFFADEDYETAEGYVPPSDKS
ncbi:MAG: oxidative damage protection protein [Kangiellaceae bacterium]|jgi:Fe-S cluster biosynthesis and repair protein YggX|nr:oxidative damage protection protein [Kangiellaceae bacterium]|tara:strand:+ start:7864 stop:8142 length:279 start_codon:yes stop_codon:yes gene_type:complete